MNGERIKDVTTHPAFKPIVDIRARIYDLAHEKAIGAGHDLCRRDDRGDQLHRL